MAEPTAGRTATAGALFLFLTLVYALATGGHVYSPDALTMARTTESLVDRHALWVPDPGYPPGFLAEGREGRRYSKYGLAMPVAGLPGLLVGRGIGKLLGDERAGPLFRGPRFLWYDAGNPREAWTFFGISLTAAPLVAGGVTLLFLLATDAGWPRRRALVVAAVAGLASPLPVYAKTFFSEPLALLALTGVAWALGRAAAGGSEGEGSGAAAVRWAVIAGGFLGLAVAAKTAHLVLLPVALGALLWAHRRTGRSRGSSIRSALALLAGVAPWGLALAAANAARFGSPFETGYGTEATRFTTPLQEGLRGLLVSPGRGLLVYLPLSVVAALAIPRFARRAPALAIWTAGSTVVFLALYAPWHGWDGGWTWGPRFFVPLVPVLTLAAAPWLVGEVGALRRGVAWLAVAWGAGLNGLGTLVPFTEYHDALREVAGGGYLLMARWNWGVWPGEAYRHLPWNYWLLPRLFTVPGAWPLAAAAGAAIGCLPFLVWKAWLPAPARGRRLGAVGAGTLGAALAVGLAALGAG